MWGGTAAGRAAVNAAAASERGRRRLGPCHIVRDGWCRRRRGGESGAAIRAGDVEAEGTFIRWCGGVSGAGRLVSAAAVRAPAVLVAGGRTPTRARGVCRACAAAAVMTPTTHSALMKSRVRFQGICNKAEPYCCSTPLRSERDRK